MDVGRAVGYQAGLLIYTVRRRGYGELSLLIMQICVISLIERRLTDTGALCSLAELQLTRLSASARPTAMT